MKYIVSRTSVWCDETQPCPGARREQLDGFHFYTAKSIKEIEANPYQQRHVGKFEMWNGKVVRPDKFTEWVIDVEDLVAFVAEHGRIVVGPAHNVPGMLEIEIYDGYRE